MSINPSLLPALAWFVHIARHRSFTKAATEMEMSRAALSQHLKSLEQQLNVRLLHRTTRDMSLTEEGQRLFDAVAPALKTIDTAVAELGEVQSAPSGLIRVNTSRIAARTLLEPYLGEFLARYPGLRLELVLNDGFANIIAGGADVGIRLGESLDEHMVAVPITPRIEMAVVGSPAYFERHGIPQTPAELVQHNCLAYRFTSSGTIDRWSFTAPDAEAHTQVFEPRGSAVFNDDESMLRAALQGAGLIKYLDICVREQLASGELVRVLQPWCQPFPGFYLYAPTRAQMPAKVRVLIDFLVEKRSILG
ncbi:TPA: LysR family transcriptional regulator [Pseudomonas aeruginosa]|uniref:LysR family transcriptional regulator n=1 Tax=Pseudomonas aeruginosa TaxID=287 RepID=UPI00071CD8DF|nr:LysR family transcriptional regulator [Pseudomonas aeruginosa]KSP56500.1 LysR family transcriptional regulator [Pseudomonas aeruginosa]MEE3527945.1 LysR family transcriptional regulator [Pseudomonas aeruginosa]NBK31113.1 LysR family transcriptional regulator [Pseudomonas aeruginosa]NBY87798.1 LysR family transcriptional regulator [Pseudomonas aeruginosa]NPX05852.1 LysR family transcriptional regulator [Pseudomonas aeruginosa]